MKRQDTAQTFKLSADMKAQVVQFSQKHRRTVAEVIREAIASYLKAQST